jgi:hypothetical protein
VLPSVGITHVRRYARVEDQHVGKKANNMVTAAATASTDRDRHFPARTNHGG